MRNLLTAVILATGIFIFAGKAAAYTWTDTYDPNPDTYLYLNPISFTHDITDSGFNPGEDTVNWAFIYLNFYDDDNVSLGNPETRVEWVSINLDSHGDTSYNLMNNPSVFSSVTASWLNDGKLNVVVTPANYSDFYFASSTLTVNGTQAAPEPATVSLLGLGMLGMLVRRKA